MYVCERQKWMNIFLLVQYKCLQHAIWIVIKSISLKRRPWMNLKLFLFDDTKIDIWTVSCWPRCGLYSRVSVKHCWTKSTLGTMLFVIQSPSLGHPMRPFPCQHLLRSNDRSRPLQGTKLTLVQRLREGNYLEVNSINRSTGIVAFEICCLIR